MKRSIYLSLVAAVILSAGRDAERGKKLETACAETHRRYGRALKRLAE